jgi:hypothetical protein
MTDAAALATLLRDLVDVLIPGEEGWPAASIVGVQGVLAMRLMEVRGQDACDGLERAVLAAGGPLAPLDEAGRIAVVQRLEQSEPALFKLLRSAVYLGYYENPAVIRAVQGLGQPYKAVPIFEGYEQAPFDLDRDRPRHNRGHWIRTEDVRPVDVAGLELEEGKHAHA